MASGMARGAAARGKKIAFGDGKRIIWDHYSELVFRDNPNVMTPQQYAEMSTHPGRHVEWVRFYRGERMYNRHDQFYDRWIWNYDFRAKPGEFYFSDKERSFADRLKPGTVVIEPNLPGFKSAAANKQWPVERYQKVADALRAMGHQVVQFIYGPGFLIMGARYIKTPTFREGAALLARSELYIGPEGGLHHAAAAVGIPAVVLFGGFIPPQVTGYETHTNLTGGAEACGSLSPCEHCKRAMQAISCDEVLEGAQAYLKRKAA